MSLWLSQEVGIGTAVAVLIVRAAARIIVVVKAMSTPVVSSTDGHRSTICYSISCSSGDDCTGCHCCHWNRCPWSDSSSSCSGPNYAVDIVVITVIITAAAAAAVSDVAVMSPLWWEYL